MRWSLCALALLTSCGLKAPPKPPLEFSAPPPASPAAQPDAGCCGAGR